MKPRQSYITPSNHNYIDSLTRQISDLERAPARPKIVLIRNPSELTKKKKASNKGATKELITESFIVGVDMGALANPSLGSGTEAVLYHVELESAEVGIIPFTSIDIDSAYLVQTQDSSTNIDDIFDSITNHPNDDAFFVNWTWIDNVPGVFGFSSGYFTDSVVHTNSDHFTVRVRLKKVRAGLFDVLTVGISGFGGTSGYVANGGSEDVPGSPTTYEATV